MSAISQFNPNSRDIIWRSRWWSIRLNSRVPGVITGVLLLTLVGIIWSASQGEYDVPVLEVLKAMIGLPTNQPEYLFIVHTLRLPRALVAWTVGLALAIAGCITQGLTRNPLASPDIIGINAGAALATVSVLILVPTFPSSLIPFVAFCGALITALIIYILTWNGGTAPIRLILIGVAVGLVANALTDVMITFGDINTVSQALVWLAGSVYGRSWDQLWAMGPWLIIFGGLALLLNRDLNVLQLGDEVACGLGIALELKRFFLLVISVALAGAAVASAGTIGFVSLIAPHIGRQLVGPSPKGLLPVSGVLGGLLVVWADLIGRLLFAPLELPCGIITAVVGAPYFLFLLIRNRS